MPPQKGRTRNAEGEAEAEAKIEVETEGQAAEDLASHALQRAAVEQGAESDIQRKQRDRFALCIFGQ